ncbi:MAG: chromosomal replication initiator protein DnaA [Oscillospiraceae bacterium]|jgi:chromosomal replication initiator protein|nr:chromosomal replication initiator protein DnaA [Oscillospiraceae bacterium]
MNSANDVWNKVQDILRADLTETAISTWFDECSAVELTNNRLLIHTPSIYKKEVIEGRFIGSIRSALNDLFSSTDFDVIILNDDGLNAMTEATETPDYLGIDEYTFEHFVVGNSNKFAHAAALAVSDGSQKQGYNPLFIYGESGLGKTHLLYAIRHAVESKFPHYNVVYVKGDDFTNDLITAIKQGKNVEFRERYRGADFLLMDDIQFIAGREGTQEEYFNTYNTLFELGKQIVLTSDRAPSELYKLEDRLRTRFEQGLLADIQPPDEVLRIAIIRNKAEQLGVVLPEDVTNYIADNLDSNVRQLEGAVKMIIAYRDIMDDDITVDTVKANLKDMFKGEKDLIPTTDMIIEETAKYYSQTSDDVKGQSRFADTTLARHIAMYLIRKLTNLSLKDIGIVFDGRDHSTVLTSVRKVEKKIREEKDFPNIIRDITSNINSKN